MLPQGDWHCPNCSCKYCEMATEAGVKAGSTPLVCCLYESKYHESCNLEMDDNSVNPTDPNLSFCGHECRHLYNNLQKLVGVKHELDSGFSWGDMEGVHSYVEGICGRDGLVGVVEDDMEGVHSSQFLGKNGEEWANGGSFLFLYSTPFSCGFQPSSTTCIWFIIKF
ncbi:hypothetical protein Hanom_Chr03g00209441 [Helianthus anomalus]